MLTTALINEAYVDATMRFGKIFSKTGGSGFLQEVAKRYFHGDYSRKISYYPFSPLRRNMVNIRIP